MGAAHLPASHMDRGDDHFFHLQLVQKITGSSNVKHRVQRSHFMEMDLLHRPVMDGAFGVGDPLVNRKNGFLYLFGDTKPFDNGTNFFDAIMTMGFVGVRMLVSVFMGMVMGVFMGMMVRVVAGVLMGMFVSMAGGKRLL